MFTKAVGFLNALLASATRRTLALSISRYLMELCDSIDCLQSDQHRAAGIWKPHGCPLYKKTHTLL